MLSMNLFRQLRRHTLLVLILYGLTLGTALASSWLFPEKLNAVCSSAGLKFVDASGKVVKTDSLVKSLDCLQCLPNLLPELPDWSRRDLSQAHLSYALPSSSPSLYGSRFAFSHTARGPPLV